MTTRALMSAIAGIAVGLWLLIACVRTVPVTRHLRPDPAIPGTFVVDGSYCDRLPIWPKFCRMLLGRPWPGDYRCPDHPGDDYVPRDPGC